VRVPAEAHCGDFTASAAPLRFLFIKVALPDEACQALAIDRHSQLVVFTAAGTRMMLEPYAPRPSFSIAPGVEVTSGLLLRRQVLARFNLDATRREAVAEELTACLNNFIYPPSEADHA
jgi:hypothetical protein